MVLYLHISILKQGVIFTNNKIRVLYHSSIKISNEKTLYFDPYMIKKAENDADYIFITHDHYDHYSPSDIEKVINKNTVIFAPYSLKNEIKNAIFLNPNEKYENEDISVLAVPSYNIGKKISPQRKFMEWICGNF